MLFEPGNAEDLARQVEALCSDPARLQRMRADARNEYESKYHASGNYEQLMAIYERSLALRHNHEARSVHYHKLGRRQPA
jgi:glycosyltransferase involved in cell wall biosynthesis